MNLEKKIIQILMYEGGQLKKTDLAKFLNVGLKDIEESVLEVKNLLSILDLGLVQNETHLEITLSPSINSLISKNKIEELSTPLSESAMQTLSVILYKNKATLAEINFIRGVDSARSIKSLLSRGIIERSEEKNKKYYTPAIETLKYLNIESLESLVDKKEIEEKLKNLIEGE